MTCAAHQTEACRICHPPHYTGHPSGVECIEIAEHFTFCLGNVIKYVWRAGLKSENAIEDLEKAKRYLEQEIERLSEQQAVRLCELASGGRGE